MPGDGRERTLYEISSSFFAALVIVFAVAGMLVVGLGEQGPLSPEFAICVLFLLLGLGRLWLGLRRGSEGVDRPPGR
jgi:lipopolysaccharide export LptBFGC system permease protein LptF